MDDSLGERGRQCKVKERERERERLGGEKREGENVGERERDKHEWKEDGRVRVKQQTISTRWQ